MTVNEIVEEHVKASKELRKSLRGSRAGYGHYLLELGC